MRRLTSLPLVSAAVVLVTATLVAPAAHAEPVVVSRTGLPAGFGFVSGNGIDPTDTTGDGAEATLRARGTVFPAKPGATVTLWRTTASSTTKVGSATVQANGSYAINRTVTKGTWRVHVTVPASTGNLAGKSVTRTATVG